MLSENVFFRNLLSEENLISTEKKYDGLKLKDKVMVAIYVIFEFLILTPSFRNKFCDFSNNIYEKNYSANQDIFTSSPIPNDHLPNPKDKSLLDSRKIENFYYNDYLDNFSTNKYIFIVDESYDDKKNIIISHFMAKYPDDDIFIVDFLESGSGKKARNYFKLKPLFNNFLKDVKKNVLNQSNLDFDLRLTSKIFVLGNQKLYSQVDSCLKKNISKDLDIVCLNSSQDSLSNQDFQVESRKSSLPNVDLVYPEKKSYVFELLSTLNPFNAFMSLKHEEK